MVEKYAPLNPDGGNEAPCIRRDKLGCGLRVAGAPDVASVCRACFSELALKPFDQAILAAILVRAKELWDEGERDLVFAELDGDLQPWDRDGNPKLRLIELYNAAHVWVYGDFELLTPERPANWQDSSAK
jgi:hypothetical protein